MSLQKVDGEYQGAVYPFSYDTPPSGPPISGPIVCRVAPNGTLYVGSLRDAGWGGGQNTGEIIRLDCDTASIPQGIAEITATSTGFSIRFTRPIDASLMSRLVQQPDGIQVMSYRRISTPKYGGDDIDRRGESVKGVEQVQSNELHITLTNERRAGFVYEFRLSTLQEKGEESDARVFPSEGHYTLNRIPS